VHVQHTLTAVSVHPTTGNRVRCACVGVAGDCSSCATGARRTSRTATRCTCCRPQAHRGRYASSRPEPDSSGTRARNGQRQVHWQALTVATAGARPAGHGRLRRLLRLAAAGHAVRRAGGKLRLGGESPPLLPSLLPSLLRNTRTNNRW
jgi:hypothetical protein